MSAIPQVASRRSTHFACTSIIIILQLSSAASLWGKHGICYHQIRNMVETHSTTSRFDHREQVSCSRLDNFYTGLRAQYPKRYSNCISTLTSRFVRVPTLKLYSPRSCERARNPGKDQDAQQVGIVPSSSKNMEEFGTVGCQSNVDSLFFQEVLHVTRGMRQRGRPAPGRARSAAGFGSPGLRRGHSAIVPLQSPLYG